MTETSSSNSEFYNILHILFTCLAGICFIGAIGVLLYEALGMFKGEVWQQIKLHQVVVWLFGNFPMNWQVETVLKIAPLGFCTLGLAWILNKISDVFESKS